MSTNSEAMENARCVIRFFAAAERPVCERHGLSQVELDVLAFLMNHPNNDTARDIVELRMLPKANVSQAVDSLMRRGLLTREQDCIDRRRIHLHLTADALALRGEIEEARDAFQKQLFAGFSAEERTLYARMCLRISQNAMQAMERKQN